MSTFRKVEAVVIFTLLVAATCGFGLYLFAATVEPIRRDIPFTYAEMGMITGAVQIGYLLAALAGGALTVRYGPLPVINAGIVICAAALGVLSQATTALVTAACMTVLGGCASAVWIPMVELIAKIVPRAHRGKALGLASSGTSYGVVAISMLTGAYLVSDGWRHVWLVACLLVTGLALIAMVRLRWLSGIDGGAADATCPPTLRERLQTLPRGISSFVLLLMFLTGLTCTPFQTYLSSFLETERRMPVDAVSTAWWLIGMTGMAGGLAIGALADRISVRPAMVLSYVMLAAASIALMWHGAGTAPVAISAVMFGLAFYAVFGLVPAYVAQTFSAPQTPLLLALMNVTQGCGGLLGNIVGGWGRDAFGSFTLIYCVTCAAAAAAVFVCLALPAEREASLAGERR